jgi:predicted nucleic-acid-binding Zn-ribbon protein
MDKLAFLRRYVCSACNYTESYIADKESMKHILEGFEPLNKEKRKNEG